MPDKNWQFELEEYIKQGEAVQYHKERVGTERRYSHLCGLEQY